MSDALKINTKDLDFSDSLLVNLSKYIPNLAAQNLIDFQKNRIKKNAITLGYAIEDSRPYITGKF
jgi:hypothetical protein